MPFVMRRIMHGKPGAGNQLIELLEKANIMVRGVGLAVKPRVLSDANTGRTDRVVMEWEADSVEELGAVEGGLFAYPEGPELFRETLDELFELIEYSEVETWAVH